MAPIMVVCLEYNTLPAFYLIPQNTSETDK